MLIDFDFTTGLNHIWETNAEYQTECLKGIIANIRHIDKDSIAELHINYLKQQGAFFVHNHDYIAEHFGEYVRDPKYGLYTSYGKCYLAGRLAIPIRMFDDRVSGFIGYSSKPADFENDAVFIKYLYPPKTAFTKGRYFYITNQEYIKAIEDGYICIVDGIFDKIILQCLGINAVSLCGSSLTRWHEMYLSFIKHKIVIADNDIAGRRLASYCRYRLKNCIEIVQSDTGDIDSMLRSDEAIKNLTNCIEEMKLEGFILSKRLPSLRPRESLTLIDKELQ